MKFIPRLGAIPTPPWFLGCFKHWGNEKMRLFCFCRSIRIGREKFLISNVLGRKEYSSV